MGKLTVAQIKSLPAGKEAGDGDNLWIVASRSGRKRWEFRYTVTGKRRWMGLGPWPEVTLTEAREAAYERRRELAKGIDPLAERHTHQPKRITTFKEVAEEAIARFAKGWTGPKQEPQWRSSLERYAYPILGRMHVATIEPEHVRDVLEPIWHSKAPTAERVQNRIERILDFATAGRLRTGDNPARLKVLEHLLGDKGGSEQHFNALPHKEVPAFLSDLRDMGGIAARALEFVILTATRTNETTNARWTEFDLEAGVWTIPLDRLKTRRKRKQPFKIPLSKQAVALLKALPRDSVGDYVFIGAERGKPVVSDLRRVLVRMGRTDITSHGFRSSFRDWVADKTSYPDAAAEFALGHAVKNKVEAAYLRTEMFDKRIPLMQDWADFCDGRWTEGKKVVPIRAKR